jgi:hypothetical protein
LTSKYDLADKKRRKILNAPGCKTAGPCRAAGEAPKIAEEQEKRRREELMTRTPAKRSRRGDTPVLTDKRFELQVSVAASRPSRKTLKAEKRDARLKFFALFVLLILVLLWVRHMMP